MSRRVRIFSVLGVFLIVATTLATIAFVRPFTSSAQPAATSHLPNDVNRAHDLHSLISDHQRALRQAALEMVAKGQAHGNVVRVGHGKRGYVELAREGESPVWGILAEFGNQYH